MNEPKIVYQTTETGLYIGQCVADPCPFFENFFLVPDYCVEVPPPDVGTNEAAQWGGNAWHVVPDWRGHVYWTKDRKRIQIVDIGVAPPADALDDDPGPTPEEIKAGKVRDIKAQMASNDLTKVRALTDALLHGDTPRLADIEAKQQVLRDQLSALNT